MNINYTLFGQLIAFVFFVVFCMKYVWPPLIEIMRERQRKIAEGLSKAEEAEKQLAEANSAADAELEQAKKQSAELIAQAQSRANQIVEEAREQAREESARIVAGAQSDIDQEINRAREELRERVGQLAVEGASKILDATVDETVHQDMLNKLAAEL